MSDGACVCVGGGAFTFMMSDISEGGGLGGEPPGWTHHGTAEGRDDWRRECRLHNRLCAAMGVRVMAGWEARCGRALGRLVEPGLCGYVGLGRVLSRTGPSVRIARLRPSAHAGNPCHVSPPTPHVRSLLRLALQVNRLAGIAVMLHCLIPPSWVPPLQTPSAAPIDCESGAARARAGCRVRGRYRSCYPLHNPCLPRPTTAKPPAASSGRLCPCPCPTSSPDCHLPAFVPVLIPVFTLTPSHPQTTGTWRAGWVWWAGRARTGTRASRCWAPAASALTYTASGSTRAPCCPRRPAAAAAHAFDTPVMELTVDPWTRAGGARWRLRPGANRWAGAAAKERSRRRGRGGPKPGAGRRSAARAEWQQGGSGSGSEG